MGRSYWFECTRCGYRARVSGRSDRGFHFSVQTVVCRDCRELFDAVTGFRVPQLAAWAGGGLSLWTMGFMARGARSGRTPPTFHQALNRLSTGEGGGFRWVAFKPQCPNSPRHRTEVWFDLGKCPRCGVFLDKSALPFRIWD
jgi:hypothetical protein